MLLNIFKVRKIQHVLKVFFILTLLFVMYCTPKYKPYKITIEADYVEVQFGRLMSKNLLDSISTVLISKGIKLSFPVVQYDGDKLSKLEFVIDDGEHMGTASTHFLNKGKSFGFKVDRRAQAKSKLVVGEFKNNE